ncbi:MAG: hypothetical protein IJ184_03405 [Alphaproteobacteria bacterium]|nr:hypothetical protein [Alphaproteobacteria bacterium]
MMSMVDIRSAYRCLSTREKASQNYDRLIDWVVLSLARVRSEYRIVYDLIAMGTSNPQYLFHYCDFTISRPEIAELVHRQYDTDNNPVLVKCQAIDGLYFLKKQQNFFKGVVYTLRLRKRFKEIPNKEDLLEACVIRLKEVKTNEQLERDLMARIEQLQALTSQEEV